MNISVHRHNHYRVCGLLIGSSVPFPELRAEPNIKRKFSTDVEFELGGDDLSRWVSGDVVMTGEESDGTPWLTCTRTSDGYRFHFPDLADFLVDSCGRHVSCIARSGTAPATIRHLFLDQVIPQLLNLRGREALHASAIQTEMGACAFIGQSGRGKSTLAAAFHVTGYPIICDDCLLLKETPDQMSVEPAYPGLRLWDDSRGVLFGNTQSTMAVSQYTSKRRILTAESNTDGVGFFPLHAIYSLRRHNGPDSMTDPMIEPLSVRDAFMELVEFAFRLDLTDHAMILRQMRVLERVAKEVPVKRLCLPDDLRSLPAAREMVRQDLIRT